MVEACKTANVRLLMHENWRWQPWYREIKRLLAERPKAQGLAVPGMPAGSPGMEQDGRRDPYEVLLFQRDGRNATYARY